MEGLIVAVGVGIAVVAGNALAPRLHLPVPLTLVLLGFLCGFIPGLDRIEMPPDVVLLLFLPALLFWESLMTSRRAIMRDLRGILLTSTLLVVTTAFAVGGMAWALGIPWAAALILGAAVAPPDATATAALARGLPRRQFMLLKAESLTNDGMALVVYGIAIGLAMGGHYTLWDITEKTLISFGGGLIVGVATALVSYPVLSRLTDSIVINMALILVPYSAYLAAELVEASGVLAVVVSGLILAAVFNRISTPASRLQAHNAWPLATSLLNGALFLLIGLEARVLVFHVALSRLLELALLSVAVMIALIVSRFVFLQVTVMIIRALDRRPEQRSRRMTYRARVVSSLAAFRGAVSLAIALSIPLVLDDGSAFPFRGEVVLITALTIVISMVAQGALLPRVIAWAARSGHPDDQEEAELSQEQRVADGKRAIFDHLRPELPQLVQRADAPPRMADELLKRMDRLNSRTASAQELAESDEVAAMRRLNRLLIARKRELLTQLVRERQISDETALVIRARIDLEEIRLSGYMPYE